MFSLLALALSIAAPTPVANVHLIYCMENHRAYQGTGFFIGNGIMATALHVASTTHCVDATTEEKLTTYATDSGHDFALMSGSHSDSIIKYSCKRPKPGVTYTSYGYSSAYKGGDFWNPLPLYFNIVASKVMLKGILGLANKNPMRIYDGRILPGMSGGPVTDKEGIILAINNAGNEVSTDLYDLADTALCTGKWDK